MRQSKYLLLLSVVISSLLAAPSWAAVQTIANGPAGDGIYSAAIDDYGSIASAGFGGGGDLFNPVGANAGGEINFTKGLFVFVPSTHRELLADNNTWQTGLGTDFTTDTSLARSVTTPNAAFDTNGDSVNDKLTSAFNVSGAGVNLNFTLTQSVTNGAPGTAVHTQTYVVTNNSGAPLSFALHHAADPDLFLVGDNNDDLVGAAQMPGANGARYVFQREASGFAEGVSLWSPESHTYNGLKSGVNPSGGGAAYPGGGSHFDTWNAYGFPAGWINDIATVGQNVDGTSNPAQSSDAGIALQWNLSLANGASQTINIYTTYGGVPVPEPSSCLLAAIGFVAVARYRMRKRA